MEDYDLVKPKKYKCNSYRWTHRPTGYSRLFSDEDTRKAKASLSNARRKGVSFKITHTFAGMRVTVTSLPIKYMDD